MNEILPADHLGSTTAVVNAAGAPISWHAYWPYGGHRAGAALPTDRGYTGQQYEGGISDTNLYYYHARFYSPALAHFVSPDTIVPEVSQRGLNRYSYTVGNPVKYTDDSGHCFVLFGEDMTDDCTFATVMTLLRCGFDGACKDIVAAGVPRDSAISLSRWAFHEMSFFNWVTWYGNASALRDEITSITIEAPFQPLSEDLVVPLQIGGGVEGEGGLGAPSIDGSLPQTVAHLAGYSMSISYLDVLVWPLVSRVSDLVFGAKTSNYGPAVFGEVRDQAAAPLAFGGSPAYLCLAPDENGKHRVRCG